MPRPYWMLNGFEPGGEEQVALPPDPHVMNNMCVGLRDWIDRQKLWDDRKITPIPGAGGDSAIMMRESFRENIGCTPMSGDCLSCKEYEPSRCLLPVGNENAVCPLDVDGYRHTPEDCIKCDNFNKFGYVCKKWYNKGANWKDLWGSEAGKTAIVVAPGPHLNKYVDEINELAKDRERYFTIGISRAINSVPLNYYFTIERRKPAGWDAKDRKYPQTTLIASTCSDWKLCRAFRNRYFGETFNTTSERGQIMDSGMERLSVVMGNAAADVMVAATKLGAKRILVYGYEFCCTVTQAGKDGKETVVDGYYNDMKLGDPHLRMWGVADVKYFPCLGIDGKKVATSYHLITVASYCEAVAEMIQRHGAQVENRTKEGLWWLNQKSPEEWELLEEVARLMMRVEELEKQCPKQSTTSSDQA